MHGYVIAGKSAKRVKVFGLYWQVKTEAYEAVSTAKPIVANMAMYMQDFATGGTDSTSALICDDGSMVAR
ncbi:hypothetical protein ABTM90_20705, partial [Acinetobacter baumannii]